MNNIRFFASLKTLALLLLAPCLISIPAFGQATTGQSRATFPTPKAMSSMELMSPFSMWIPASSQQRLLSRLGATTADEEDALVDYAEFLRSKRRKGK